MAKKITESKKEPVKKEQSKKVKLENELKSLLKEIDESGLTFLIDQANIIIHNTKVDKINKSKTDAVKGGKKGKGEDAIEIIPGEKNSNFIIRIETARKFFSLEDFRGLVRVCHAEGTPVERASKVYNWLLKERKDFLIDNNMKDSKNENLKKLIEMIKSKYKAKS